MKGKTGKKNEAGAKSKATEKVKVSAPAKKAKNEPAVVEDAKPARRSARVAYKQMEAKPNPQSDDIEESQTGGEDEWEYKPTNDELLPDATKKENNQEPKKAHPQPKTIADKKAQSPQESKVPQTKVDKKAKLLFNFPLQPLCFLHDHLQVQPPPETKIPQAKAIADNQQKAVADKRTAPQPPPESTVDVSLRTLCVSADVLFPRPRRPRTTRRLLGRRISTIWLTSERNMHLAGAVSLNLLKICALSTRIWSPGDSEK
ncbi:hypothetical protein BT96DRAFT_74073 [Gymnopus androsaceus JB14]|uniref:Uncharacterized protein n=1 Tax=Gymnopus androsaceus JB14 TaxID=1447944 RepID=A0A6A4GCT1_9AGAR|nr:hypothetical protein BT96DRAFT_74073 [Gymnopus androsaceus JB14]